MALQNRNCWFTYTQVLCIPLGMYSSFMKRVPNKWQTSVWDPVNGDVSFDKTVARLCVVCVVSRYAVYYELFLMFFLRYIQSAPRSKREKACSYAYNIQS